MQIEKYSVGEDTDWLTCNIDEARQVAKERRSYVVAWVFEFSDSELVEDYRCVHEWDSDEEHGALCAFCGAVRDEQP